MGVVRFTIFSNNYGMGVVSLLQCILYSQEICTLTLYMHCSANTVHFLFANNILPVLFLPNMVVVVLSGCK